MARSNAGPMDFDWSNGNGPVDNNSPFFRAIDRVQGQQDQSRGGNAPKRPYNSFLESPSRSQSSFPNLRPAAGQTTLFNFPRSSSPEKPLPAPPNLDAFRTPRRLEPDFSSGGETPEQDTPNNDADSEATPEQFHMPRISPKKAGSQSVVASEKAASPKKKMDSFMDRIMSPSRKNFLKPYSRKAEQRVVKRRANQKQSAKALTRYQDVESDSEAPRHRHNANDQPQKASFVQGTLTPWFKLIEDHPNAPSILIGYLQVLTNGAIMLFFMYVAYSLWSGIVGDVSKGVDETMSETMLEIMNCKKDWGAMNCDKPVKSAIDICDQLARCMNRDAEKVAKAQVSARTFAKIINEFAEHISYKAMAFYLALFSIFWYFTNATWSGLKTKLSPDHFVHGQQYHPMAPPTPYRQTSNGMYAPNTPYGMGYHTPGGYLQSGMEPGPSSVATSNEQRRLDFG